MTNKVRAAHLARMRAQINWKGAWDAYTKVQDKAAKLRILVDELEIEKDVCEAHYRKVRLEERKR